MTDCDPFDSFELAKEMHQIFRIQMWYNLNVIFGFTITDKAGNVIKEMVTEFMKNDSKTITLEEGETIVGVRCAGH